MNAIQLRVRIDQLIDRTRTARHDDAEYYNAINAASTLLVKDRLEAIRVPRKYSAQSSQRIRSELYTLIPDPPVTGALVSGNVPYPADYLFYSEV